MRNDAAVALAAIATLAMMSGCSSGSPAFSLGNAVVDATYACPSGSDNAPYQLHAKLDAHNPTSTAVTIRSVTARLKLQAIKGPWLEKVGDTFDAGSATFAPDSVAAGANSSITVTIASACTSDKSIIAPISYGEYLVTLHITTSSGAYTLSSTNRHRLVAT
jgi:hypothetical protein